MTSSQAKKTSALWLLESKTGQKIERLPSDEEHEYYGKALLIVTKGDGTLAQEERDWVIGALTSYGASDSVIENLKKYEATEDLEEVVSKLSKDSKAKENERRTIIYNALKACSADGSYNEGEKSAIYKYASLLGISNDVVQQIENLYHENEKLVQKKREVLAIDQRFS